MYISLANILRFAAEKFDITIGKTLVDKLDELKKEIPEINRGFIKDPNRKTKAVDIIADEFIKLINQKKGHGIKSDKAEEFISTVEKLRKENDFKGLITYPVNFAMAFKYKIKADLLIN